ncbi:MAG: hypothetical protein LBC75_05765 [Fibromonadaceae bacterium]|jgi:uncharacterized protein (TIGR02145 family)|nr:hypothetical protein [Fibromonadaceae bacterium]
MKKLLFTTFAAIAILGCGSGQDSPNDEGGSCDIKGYKTVKIGDQVWIAKNLNCNVAGSKCYEDDPANCSKYGRLYDWATAMALPDSCNSNSCSSQIGEKHKGICPSGWHIPNNEDWSTLVDFVGYPEGIQLKATSGWNSYQELYPGNGTDDYGFYALPGGVGDDEEWWDIGNYAYWWNAEEYGLSDSEAHYQAIAYDADYLEWYYGDKIRLHSVRCLKD